MEGEKEGYSREEIFNSVVLKEHNVFSALGSTITSFTVGHMVLSVGLLLAFHFMEYTFEMRTDIASLAVVFPLVFSIQSAYVRREYSIKLLANMKGTAHSIRLIFHHYKGGVNVKGSQDIDRIFHSVFTKINKYFVSDDFSRTSYKEILDHFSAMSWMIELHLTRQQMPPPQVSRVQECLRSFINDFEEMRNMKVYRTPIALRAYTKLFVCLFPVLFAPLFAHIAREERAVWGSVVLTILFSTILTGLDAIQDGLEQPFDGEGIDDIQFEDFVVHMLYDIANPLLGAGANGHVVGADVLSQFVSIHHDQIDVSHEASVLEG